MKRPYLTLGSGAPIFDGNEAVCWFVDMTSHVEDARVQNIAPGVLYTFLFRQDGAGGYVFNWPAQCINPAPVDPAPHAVTVQTFIGIDSGRMIANMPGAWLKN